MKILLCHRHFWPDTPPYAEILRVIGERLVSDGHDVNVFTCQPFYKLGVSIEHQPPVEKSNGVLIRRITIVKSANSIVKQFNNFYYLARLFVHLARHDYDVVMISTVPQVIGGQTVRLASKLKGFRYFYHCMDISPEVARIAGYFRNEFMYKILQRIDAATCRDADTTIVLSNDMKHSLITRNNSLGLSEVGPNIRVLNNFEVKGNPESLDLVPYGGTSSQTTCHDKSSTKLLFAGNIGRFQGLEFVIQAKANTPKHLAVELQFLGEGSQLPSLKALALELDTSNVVFKEHVSVQEARQRIRDADLCLVSLAPKVINYAYPSKVLTYLAEGKPLLAVVETDSDMAKEIRDHNLGFTVPHGDIDMFVRTISDVCANKYQLKEMQESVVEYFGKISADKKLDEWVQMFKADQMQGAKER